MPQEVLRMLQVRACDIEIVNKNVTQLIIFLFNLLAMESNVVLLARAKIAEINPLSKDLLPSWAM